MSNQSTLGGDTVSEREMEKQKERAKRDDGGPLCECGKTKEYVNEPIISGFRGYLCTNDNCSVDS